MQLLYSLTYVSVNLNNVFDSVCIPTYVANYSDIQVDYLQIPSPFTD